MERLTLEEVQKYIKEIKEKGLYEKCLSMKITLWIRGR